MQRNSARNHQGKYLATFGNQLPQGRKQRLNLLMTTLVPPLSPN
jgi:hypothetical protein